MYSDSHAHLVDYSDAQLEKVLALMRQKQVGLVLAVGVNLESSEGTVKLAEAHPEIKAAVGTHPWFAVKLDDAMRRRFEKLAASPNVSALGEIGLDYEPPRMQAAPGAPKMHFPKNMPPLPEPPSSPEVQKALFTYEISIAAKYALPVNVHCLHGAHADAMKILRAHPGLRGIAHSFEGDMAMLRDWLDLGFLIALGTKQVIGEPLPDLEAIVRAIPPDRLVVETDANPMMSPENGPVDVIPVVRKLAAIRGASEAAIGQQTTVNLKKCLQR